VISIQEKIQTNKVVIWTHIAVPVVGPLELEDLARFGVVIMPNAQQPSAELVQVRLWRGVFLMSEVPLYTGLSSAPVHGMPRGRVMLVVQLVCMLVG